MRKSIKILDVQPAHDVNETLRLAETLGGRKLARLQRSAESDPAILKWLDIAHAIWRMNAGVQSETPEPDHLLDLFDTREPMLEHHPKYPKELPRAVSHKIEAWCIARGKIRRRPGNPLPEKMLDAEKREIREAADAMGAVYLTEHQVDVAFSDVHGRFPWLASLTERAWQQARRRARSGLPAGIGPLLLLGPPGIGKSSWARAVAEVMDVPRLDVDVGATGGAFDLQGTAKGWGGADKGRLMSTIISTRTANPLVVLDEIDSGDRSTSTTKGSMPGLYKILMGLIEPSTAVAWVCPYYQIPVNVRNVSWVGTCNRIQDVEQALLDRMMVIDLPDMTRDQLLAFAADQARLRFGDDFADVVVDRVHDSLMRGYRLSLRHVVKILDKVEDAINRPLLH